MSRAATVTAVNVTQEPSDLDLAALIASKICHDVIGPVGAISNGFQILDEDNDANARAYALEVIRNVAEVASAKLQFARFAFGASGSAGSTIDLQMAEQISRGLVEKEKGKHKLLWKGPQGQMPKDKAKLLLNIVYASVSALPRGGEIRVSIVGTLERPAFHVLCRGPSARPPQHLAEFIAGASAKELHALTIQPYYTCRLAQVSGMKLAIAKEGADVIIAAGGAE
jgi:histidine phosphotransferase ChpT